MECSLRAFRSTTPGRALAGDRRTERHARDPEHVRRRSRSASAFRDDHLARTEAEGPHRHQRCALNNPHIKEKSDFQLDGRACGVRHRRLGCSGFRHGRHLAFGTRLAALRPMRTVDSSTSLERLAGALARRVRSRTASVRTRTPSGTKPKYDAKWRPEPESNRRARICSPLRNHSAIGPNGRKLPIFQERNEKFFTSSWSGFSLSP